MTNQRGCAHRDIIKAFVVSTNYTAKKLKFSVKDFLSKCEQIRSFLGIWSHLLKKSFMESFIFFCSVLLFKKYCISPKMQKQIKWRDVQASVIFVALKIFSFSETFWQTIFEITRNVSSKIKLWAVYKNFVNYWVK